jgi:uncharacterized membrane protein YphA (DoxX/SURF4 family)
MAHPGDRSAPFDLPVWKKALAIASAAVLALIFLVSGVWKITEPLDAAARMTQALIPAALSLPAAIGFGLAEVFAGILLLVPRFRRWGAWLAGLMLLAFMVYFAIFYNTLRGGDCSCFPWLKRVVGPGFFISDGLMLLLAVAAGVWAKPSESLRSALVVLGAVAVFAGVSYGVTVMRQSGLKAPDAIVVDGRPLSLQHGRVFLYFFDPECAHCDWAARQMSKYSWRDVSVLVVPTRMPQFTEPFLNATGLKAKSTSDLALLRETFKFGDPPYAVILEHGRQKAAVSVFDENEPKTTLRKVGFIE